MCKVFIKKGLWEQNLRRRATVESIEHSEMKCPFRVVLSEAQTARPL